MASAIQTMMASFDKVCENPYATAREAAAQGKKIAGLMCTYVPRELFHAAGYLPVRILSREGGTPRADQLIQSYSCSFARSVLDRAMSGDLDFVDLAVFAHTCDTMQNLADLWRSNRPQQPVIIVSSPSLTAGGPAETYFRREMDRVRAALEALSGPISDEAIANSIALHEQHRAAMQRLYAFRRTHPGRFSGRDMQAVVLASEVMPIETHLALLGELLAALEADTAADVNDAPRILIAGSVCQDLGFVEAMEAAGCAIVEDDLCMGSRSFVMPAAPKGDPMDALVHLYLSRTPCPAFHRPGFDPGAHLLDRAQNARAQGVIYLLTKFCDPWAFDYPHLRNTLENAGVPTLLLEVEQNLPVPEQLRTRVEAFVEMIKMKAVQ
jgi:benzoyl-CoA reductase subunit C